MIFLAKVQPLNRIHAAPSTKLTFFETFITTRNKKIPKTFFSSSYYSYFCNCRSRKRQDARMKFHGFSRRYILRCDHRPSEGYKGDGKRRNCNQTAEFAVNET